MSLRPESSPEITSPETQTVPMVPDGRARRWQQRLLRLCFALFALEMGLFLVIFPWSDRWDLNYFKDVVPRLQDFWDEPFFRGAITGLGLVNVYIGLLQILRSFTKR